jgi:hypothetical protein
MKPAAPVTTYFIALHLVAQSHKHGFGRCGLAR